MIVPLGYVTTFPAARNASTWEGESGVRIIWRRSSPIVSTQAPQVGLLRILHGRNIPLPVGQDGAAELAYSAEATHSGASGLLAILITGAAGSTARSGRVRRPSGAPFPGVAL